MKNIKKYVSTVLAVAMLLSISCFTAFAESESNVTIIDNMIDRSIYGSDMVYIAEHAKIAEEYNAKLKSGIATYANTQWNWNNGIFSTAIGVGSGYSPQYIFTAVNNKMYFNADIRNAGSVPYLAVNEVNSDGSYTYIGSYAVTSVGNNNYKWSNRAVPAGTGKKYNYAFLTNSGTWTYLNFDIYYTSM